MNSLTGSKKLVNCFIKKSDANQEKDIKPEYKTLCFNFEFKNNDEYNFETIITFKIKLIINIIDVKPPNSKLEPEKIHITHTHKSGNIENIKILAAPNKIEPIIFFIFI